MSEKFYNDLYDSNNYVAYVSGLSLSELNNLEYEFLNIINFNLTVTTEEYESYQTAIEMTFKKTLSEYLYDSYVQICNNIKDQN